MIFCPGSFAELAPFLLLVVACSRPEEEPPRAEVSVDPLVVEWVWADGEMAWGDWGAGLFARARSEDRPLLIYLAAPGCEGLFPAPSEALRQLVAEEFVSARVDPFARPDIARHYATGGWPALVAALPDGRVFARAVDIPPRNVEPYLRRLSSAFAEKRAVLLDKVQRGERGQKASRPFEVGAVYQSCEAAFDSVHGGFDGPTKFLEAPVLRFLLAYAEARSAAEAGQMALASLDAVLDSPLLDGGAFCAYSHTPDWSQPALEKDGLDQAAMLHLLLEARGSVYAEAALGLLDFVERELFDGAEGAFRGRLLGLGHGVWWTDPTLYADRQAALIRACLAAAKALGDERAARLALRAGEVLVSRCIDDRGGVRHICDTGAAGVSGLLVDQALAALALADLHAWSGESRFAHAAQQVERFMEERLGGPVAFYHRPIGDFGLLPRLVSHRDDSRPAGNALVLELYGMKGNAERLAALAGGARLGPAPGRAHSSWARALLRHVKDGNASL